MGAGKEGGAADFKRSGLVLFDKPAGWSSHDAVAAFRRRLPSSVKAGHCGTLDPIATGLLILLFGQATRLQERFQKLDKVYTGRIRLGVATDTGDSAGRPTETKPVPELSLKDIQAAMDAFTGTMEMPAPAYSAVKYRGRPLYRYARKGIAVPPRMRTFKVHEWQALCYEAPELEHRLSCSSGTYVRSLAEELGRRLGCGAAVTALRRLKAGPFDVADAVDFSAFKAMSDGELAARIDRSKSLLLSAAGHAPLSIEGRGQG